MSEFPGPPESEYVPEFLSPNQNVLDQPPFTWLFLHPDVFPLDFWKDELQQAGEVALIRLLAENFSSVPFEKPLLSGLGVKKRTQAFLHALEDKYAHDPNIVLDTCTQAAYFLRSYSNWSTYLYEVWWHHGRKHLDFDSLGNPTGHEPAFHIRSYAAWVKAHDPRTQSELTWKTGLYDDAPDASAAANITAALPPKHPINRRFRFFKSGAIE